MAVLVRRLFKHAKTVVKFVRKTEIKFVMRKDIVFKHDPVNRVFKY